MAIARGKCASSSSTSVDEIEDKQECSLPSYTSGYASYNVNDNCAAVSSSGHITCVSQGLSGMSRLSSNPFAIKTASPARSVVDSTESRPLVAPPTLKLGNSDSCGIMPSTQKIVLRPSALSVQTEKLKFMNKNDILSKQEGKENSSDESNISRDSSVMYESNGKLCKTELFASGLSSSDEISASSSPIKTSVADSVLGQTGKISEKESSDGSFIFGQNLHERALNYGTYCEQPSSTSDAHNLTFEEAALKKEELEKMEQQHQEESLIKSLSESAKEYESKQVKRKFDEVTVITGEEEESNVLQINCKLFAFDKTGMNWQERGRGILRLNDREHKGRLHSRVVMRTQGSLRVVLNTKVWAGMSVEHPSQKTVRLTAFDPQGVKVFLVMAQPKDAEQLFSALDWRVTTLRSDGESHLKNNESQSCIEETTNSSTLPDASCDDSFQDSPNKRNRTETNFVSQDSVVQTELTGFVDSSNVRS